MDKPNLQFKIFLLINKTNLPSKKNIKIVKKNINDMIKIIRKLVLKRNRGTFLLHFG